MHFDIHNTITISADPRTKLFISHAGINSINEASFHGVPLILIPLFHDQLQNSVVAREHGIGLLIRKSEFSSKRLTESIYNILGNKKFDI